jgi:hypothetical protein
VEALPNEASPQHAGDGAERGADTVDGRRASSRLKYAMREARFDEAERSDVIAELRGAETARLEMLQEELRPILAEVPSDVDMFDMGLMPGEKLRLFIDMIGFVEMGRDWRTYRFVQDTRYGRVILAESERMEPIVDAVASYVARRLIEREKALAGDITLEQAARAYADTGKMPSKTRAKGEAGTPVPAHPLGFLQRSFIFLIEVLGSSLLVALLAIGIWTAWRFVSAWWLGHH